MTSTTHLQGIDVCFGAWRGQEVVLLQVHLLVAHSDQHVYRWLLGMWRRELAQHSLQALQKYLQMWSIVLLGIRNSITWQAYRAISSQQKRFLTGAWLGVRPDAQSDKFVLQEYAHPAVLSSSHLRKVDEMWQNACIMDPQVIVQLSFDGITQSPYPQIRHFCIRINSSLERMSYVKMVLKLGTFTQPAKSWHSKTNYARCITLKTTVLKRF